MEELGAKVYLVQSTCVKKELPTMASVINKRTHSERMSKPIPAEKKCPCIIF
jgi:hypothetical protein